jgi:hypothetical protein
MTDLTNFCVFVGTFVLLRLQWADISNVVAYISDYRRGLDW